MYATKDHLGDEFRSVCYTIAEEHPNEARDHIILTSIIDGGVHSDYLYEIDDIEFDAQDFIDLQFLSDLDHIIEHSEEEWFDGLYDKASGDDEAGAIDTILTAMAILQANREEAQYVRAA